MLYYEYSTRVLYSGVENCCSIIGSSGGGCLVSISRYRYQKKKIYYGRQNSVLNNMRNVADSYRYFWGGTRNIFGEID